MPAGRPSIADDFDYAGWLALHRKDLSGVAKARKTKRNAAKRQRLSTNPSERIRNSITARMWASLKGKSDGALFSRLPYSVDELRSNIEIKFIDGMSWENYGKWHIDHKKPCASFDLTNQDQFLECWSLDNLQPLWASDNCRKGARHAST
jgi:hypothetical protein